MLTPVLACPELIGRRAELDALAERRRTAAHGNGSLVLIAGGAGVGKTRLVRAFGETLKNGRAALGTGAYGEFGNVAYAAIAEALRGAGVTAPLAAEPTRPEQFAALREQIAAAAARRTTVLILEDVQWADDASLGFLVHLVRSIAKLRLLVVATYRDDAPHRAAPYLARLARDPAVHRMTVEPLTRAETHRLVRVTVAGRPRLPRGAAEEIVERADGNPFFAEELLKSAYAQREAGARAELPFTISAAVAERLAQLEPPARSALELAAVIGRRFDAAFLAALCARPPAEIHAVLRAARDLQLIEEHPGEPPSYAFRHALTREAIYAGMLVAEARPFHRRIVEALELRGASAADLGYHAWSAHDGERSARYNELAGDEADARHAYSDAVRAYERALDDAADDERRGRLLAKAATSSAKDGDAAAALRLYEAAIAAYERAGRGELLAGLYHLMSREARAAGESERAMAIVRRALRELPDDGTAGRAMLAAWLAMMHLDRGERVEAENLIAQAGAASADPQTAPVYANVLCYAASVDGDAERVRRVSERQLELAAADPDGGLRARFNLAFALCVLGEDREALAHFNVVLAGVRARRLALLETLACANAALIHARAGAFAEARALVERGLAIPETSTTGPIALAAAALTVGDALGDEDLVARAAPAERVESAFTSRINSTIGRIAGPYARWLHARGDRAGAEALLRRALDASAIPYGATETLLAAAELGDAETRAAAFTFVATLDADAARVPLYAATAAHLRALAVTGAGDAHAAEGHAGNGHAGNGHAGNGHARDGHARDGQARDTHAREANAGNGYAREARDRYAALGWAYHAARCAELAGAHDEAAAAFRAMGALADVRRHEAAALADVRRHEAVALAESGRRRESTARPRAASVSARRAGGVARSALSPREWEIAELIAAGAPNKTVAARLSLSPKTVEKHLSSIYEKLGLGNRSELAAFVVRSR